MAILGLDAMTMAEVIALSLFCIFALFAIGSGFSYKTERLHYQAQVREMEKSKLVALLRTKLVYCSSLEDPKSWVKERYKCTACSCLAEEMLTECDFDEVVDRATKLSPE